MDVLVRDVPEQTVITEQRMVDQAALEGWLPGAMSRVLKAAGDAAAGTVDQPYLERGHLPHEPVFIVIYEGNPNEVYAPGVEALFAAPDAHICDVAIPIAAPSASG
jgi:hypothetical protein